MLEFYFRVFKNEPVGPIKLVNWWTAGGIQELNPVLWPEDKSTMSAFFRDNLFVETQRLFSSELFNHTNKTTGVGISPFLLFHFFFRLLSCF